jgi:hypothetical protein
MGNSTSHEHLNSVPLLSQFKSLIEAACGDHEGALRTQIAFSQRCIVVSQVRSLVEFAAGDSQSALHTQQIYASGIDGFPVLSQIKSAVQAGCGDVHNARRTQIAFSRQCLLVSQIRSAAEASLGNTDAALSTQKEFINGPGLAQLAVVVGCVAGPLIGAASIGAAGFGEGGIVAGTLAAEYMSSYGGVVSAGSLCAVLQSAGAVGLQG